MELLEGLVYVAIGGAAGAMLRYTAGYYIDSSQFPWATFTVNLIGAFLLAFLTFWYVGITAETKLFLFTGLFGAFTTMSTFSLETVGLYCDGRVGAAAANFFLNAGLCVIGAALGRYAGELLCRTRKLKIAKTSWHIAYLHSCGQNSVRVPSAMSLKKATASSGPRAIRISPSSRRVSNPGPNI